MCQVYNFGIYFFVTAFIPMYPLLLFLHFPFRTKYFIFTLFQYLSFLFHLLSFSALVPNHYTYFIFSLFKVQFVENPFIFRFCGSFSVLIRHLHSRRSPANCEKCYLACCMFSSYFFKLAYIPLPRYYGQR